MVRNTSERNGQFLPRTINKISKFCVLRSRYFDIYAFYAHFCWGRGLGIAVIWTGMMYRRPELFECEKGTKRGIERIGHLVKGLRWHSIGRAVACHQDVSASVELLSID